MLWFCNVHLSASHPPVRRRTSLLRGAWSLLRQHCFLLGGQLKSPRHPASGNDEETRRAESPKGHAFRIWSGPKLRSELAAVSYDPMVEGSTPTGPP